MKYIFKQYYIPVGYLCAQKTIIDSDKGMIKNFIENADEAKKAAIKLHNDENLRFELEKIIK